LLIGVYADVENWKENDIDNDKIYLEDERTDRQTDRQLQSSNMPTTFNSYSTGRFNV